MERRKYTDFSRFYLERAGKFLVRLNLSACDTTSLQFLRTPAYPNVILCSPDLQIPDKRLDLPLSFRLDPAPSSLGWARCFPAVLSFASSNRNFLQQPFDLPPLPSYEEKGRRGTLVKIRAEKSGHGWGLGPKSARQAPRGPLPQATPDLPQPPFPTFSTRILDDWSLAFLAPSPGDVRGRQA